MLAVLKIMSNEQSGANNSELKINANENTNQINLSVIFKRPQKSFDGENLKFPVEFLVTSSIKLIIHVLHSSAPVTSSKKAETQNADRIPL